MATPELTVHQGGGSGGKIPVNVPPTGSGGGGGGANMIERIAKLEAGQDAVLREMDQRFTSVDTKLDKIDTKLLTKWDVAQVVFFVVGSLMAATLFGPRLLSFLVG